MRDQGLHLDVPRDEYDADPCPSPSLTQSIAKIILDRSLAHARLAHPRLNPAFERNDDPKYDVGNVAHALMLGRGREIEVVIADDWRTKAAKEAREAAIQRGRIAVLARHYEAASDMVQAAARQLGDRGYDEDWNPAAAAAEVMAVADDAGVWLRSLIDWLPYHARRVWDYKTTALSAAPWELSRRIVADGWDVQAAFHERILDLVDPDNAGRREHLFCVQEDRPPYALTVARMSEAVMTMGRRKVQRARDAWAAAMSNNHWPAYPLDTALPEYPAWAMREETME